MVKFGATIIVDAPLATVRTIFTTPEAYPTIFTFVEKVTRVDVVGGTIAWETQGEYAHQGTIALSAEGVRRTKLDIEVSSERMFSAEDLRALEMLLERNLGHFADLLAQASPEARDPGSPAFLFDPRHLGRPDPVVPGTTLDREVT